MGLFHHLSFNSVQQYNLVCVFPWCFYVVPVCGYINVYVNLKHFIGTTHICISTYTCACSTVHLSLRFLKMDHHPHHPPHVPQTIFPKPPFPPFRRLTRPPQPSGKPTPRWHLTLLSFLGLPNGSRFPAEEVRTKIAMHLKIFYMHLPKNCLHKNNIPRKKSGFPQWKNTWNTCKQKESIHQLPLPIQHSLFTDSMEP